MPRDARLPPDEDYGGAARFPLPVRVRRRAHGAHAPLARPGRPVWAGRRIRPARSSARSERPARQGAGGFITSIRGRRPLTRPLALAGPPAGTDAPGRPGCDLDSGGSRLAGSASRRPPLPVGRRRRPRAACLRRSGRHASRGPGRAGAGPSDGRLGRAGGARGRRGRRRLVGARGPASRTATSRRPRRRLVDGRDGAPGLPRADGRRPAGRLPLARGLPRWGGRRPR